MNKTLVAIICLTAVVGGVSYFFVKNRQTDKNNEISIVTTEEKKQKLSHQPSELTKLPHPGALLQQYGSIYQQIENPDWLQLALEALENYPEEIQILQTLYNIDPQEFKSHEEAALVLAGASLLQQKMETYRELREMWAANTRHAEGWILLDADALVADGRKEAAISLLQNQLFSSGQDVPRLIKLSLLTASTDTYQAGKYLRAAQLLDANNPSVKLLEAQFLEKSSQLTEARQEYIALYKTSGDVASIARLGDFYRRYGLYDAAISTWNLGLNLEGSEPLWDRVLFWSRVTDSDIQQLPTFVSSEKLNPFLDYLSSLKPGQFWNEAAFEEIPDHETVLMTKQETFWLRLLDSLVQGKEEKAYSIIQNNSFREVSWAPWLEETLAVSLGRRLGKKEELGSIALNPLLFELGVSLLVSIPDHPLFELFQSEESTTEANQRLLNSPEIYSALFLAMGWNEAALGLNLLDVISNQYPEWLATGLTQAIWKQQGVQAAMAFGLKQPKSESLEFLLAEMEIAGGRKQEAIKRLEELMLQNTPIGIRAAKMTAQLQAEE